MVYVTYEKLRIKMVKNRIEFKDLKTIFGFSSHTIVKLKKDKIVNMDVIMKICSYFKCNGSEIMEIIYYDESSPQP